MLFTSYEFAVLLTITFLAYYAPALSKVQIVVLLVSSFAFYAWTDPVLLFLLVFSIVVNGSMSYGAAFATNRSARLAWAATGIVVNLAVLLLFKYGSLIVTLVDNATASHVSPVDGVAFFLLHVPLPIGISFYTFEGISLLADCLHENTGQEMGTSPPSWRASPNFCTHCIRTALFIAFFPHLIAGPVLKANRFFPQIGSKRLSDINWDLVFRSLVSGYFFKMVVADNLHDFTIWLSHPYFLAASTFDNIIGLYGYSIQIFADFAGYSLIAIGLGALFGYELPQNFNFPYISTSLAEFWRRWHISLSTWLRDYLYFPLGGSRSGNVRTYVNLLTVMTLGGLWHGAKWGYAIWGLYHGVGLAIERLIATSFRMDNSSARGFWLQMAKDIVRVLAVFIFISIGWVLFALPDIEHCTIFLVSFIRYSDNVSSLNRAYGILIYSVPVVLYHLPHFPTFKHAAFWSVRAAVSHSWETARFAIYGVMLALLLLNPGTTEAFIYFQF